VGFGDISGASGQDGLAVVRASFGHRPDPPSGPSGDVRDPHVGVACGRERVTWGAVSGGHVQDIRKAAPGAAILHQLRMRGIEPPRGCPHRHLKPARLPIPPHPLGMPSRGDSDPHKLLPGGASVKCVRPGARRTRERGDLGGPSYSSSVLSAPQGVARRHRRSSAWKRGFALASPGGGRNNTT
jgi:hypothetical protein